MDDARTPAAWRFDRFTLDLARDALLGSDGAVIPLRPKSFALLRLLVENAGRILDRDAIMAAVWQGVIVTDESITQCVRDIRKALGDEEQRLLRTAPKRGYLLAAPASSAESTMAAPHEARRHAAIVSGQMAQGSQIGQALAGPEHQMQPSTLPAGNSSWQGSDELDDLSQVLDGLLMRFAAALTQRSEALDRLAASEARYNALVNTQDGFIARMTPDLRLSFVSDAYCSYYRRNRGELLGRGFDEFTFTGLDDRQRHMAHLSALTPENPQHVIVLRCRLPDGSNRWVEWTDTALFDGEGRLVEVQSVGRDITERRNSRLARGEKQMEIRMLPCGRVTFANEAFCRYVGKPRKYLLSDGFNGLDLMAPEDRPRFDEHLRKLTAEQPVASMEARAILPDGSERREYWVDKGIFGHDGRLVALRSAGRDVTGMLDL